MQQTCPSWHEREREVTVMRLRQMCLIETLATSNKHMSSSSAVLLCLAAVVLE
jgi:hypothetical protein